MTLLKVNVSQDLSNLSQGFQKYVTLTDYTQNLPQDVSHKQESRKLSNKASTCLHLKIFLTAFPMNIIKLCHKMNLKICPLWSLNVLYTKGRVPIPRQIQRSFPNWSSRTIRIHIWICFWWQPNHNKLKFLSIMATLFPDCCFNFQYLDVIKKKHHPILLI